MAALRVGRRIVALDTETTGFSPEHHRIVEVGAVEVDPRTGSMGRQLHELLNPLQPIPWAATKVHGLRDGDVRSKPHFGAVAPSIIEFVRGSILAIHNSRFDTQMLDAELARHGFAPLASFDVDVVDTLALSRELLPFLPSHKLDTVCDALNVDRSTRSKHGALLDAQLVGNALPRLAREYDATFGREDRCGSDAGSAAAELAALTGDELERAGTGSLCALEASFCRVARLWTFAKHCRLELLARWESEIAIEHWACAHFATFSKTSSSLSNAAAAKALLAPDALAAYSKAPTISRTVTATREAVLGERFDALAARFRAERYTPHALAHAIVELERIADKLGRARDGMRALLLEAGSGRELANVVITQQTRTSVDYARALRDLAPGADLTPYRTPSAALRVFQARDRRLCSAIFGPPISRRTAA